ncbi:hypothetical protein GYH30_029984 [Glycine max]|nr:hypothetical protein GYH30_029984 [Glycine max]
MEAKSWWLVHGTHAPTLQKIALKLTTVKLYAVFYLDDKLTIV